MIKLTIRKSTLFDVKKINPYTCTFLPRCQPRGKKAAETNLKSSKWDIIEMTIRKGGTKTHKNKWKTNQISTTNRQQVIKKSSRIQFTRGMGLMAQNFSFHNKLIDDFLFARISIMMPKHGKWQPENQSNRNKLMPVS